MRIAFIVLTFAMMSFNNAEPPVYKVKRMKKSFEVDARWDKKAWKNIDAVEVSHFIRQVPSTHPITEVKMAYDDDNLYVIFRVQDQYVRCLTNEINGPVWKDAAVEFFFCPDTSLSKKYFNLEVNCGGTALLGCSSTKPTPEDVKLIQVAHSLPSIIDPEMTDPVTWTLEYKLPLNMLEKYMNIIHPKKGVSWKANFCKIAENNSRPHYMTWSPIEDPKPNFHMPQYFGSLQFE
ncbi:MAG: carbohydrate-binding family 9-like protein [Flavitalea sp.]